MHSTKLLNPGPVTLTERVRHALSSEDLCHREPEFAALQSAIRERLLAVYPDAERDFSTVLLTGSGTAAVEAMVGSLVNKNGQALVVANGVYGERIAAMLEAQGKVFHLVRSEWTEPMNLPAVEHLLASEPGITHVIAVHLETTTGRLNDMRALGSLCVKYRVPLLLDTISSFGGEAIDFSAWNLLACAGTANKCLHGVPGMSFVIARRDIFESGHSGATSVYLDLFRHYREQRDGSAAFTQSVHVCHALLEALCELDDEGGWRARHARYRALSQQVFDGLERLGVAPLLEGSGPKSAVLTAHRVPAGSSYGALHDYLKQAGFVIYAGQGKFTQEIFRIAVMGAIDTTDVERLLSLCRQFFTGERTSHAQALSSMSM